MHGTDTVVNPQLRLQLRQLRQGKLCVHRNGVTPKTREFVVTSGFGPNHNLGVYNNNVDTIERAFTERYFLCKDGSGFRPAFEVSPSSFKDKFLTTFQDSVLSHMPNLPKMSRQQVVDAYAGPKKRVYEQALRSLLVDPLEEKDSYLSSFVKFEKQDISKAPRGINPRSARYNLELARYLKHAEHKFFRAINKVFGARTKATVIKGFNADESAEILRSKWEIFDDPVAIGLDASKFDMHVSEAALKYEHQFYKRLYPGSPSLKMLLKWQLNNRGIARAIDGSVSFKMRGKRCSGDINTSLGNCIIMCALVHAYAQRVGVDIELANNGDDCVVFMERRHMSQFNSILSGWFKSLGFAMTVEPPAHDFEALEFCQTRPVLLSSGWRMVRNLEAVMTKDPMCLIPIPNINVLRKWYGAIGQCGTILCRGVPVLQSLYSVFLRHGVKPSAGLISEVFKNRSVLAAMSGVKDAQVTPVSRVSFYYATGVLPDHQIQLESYYNTMELSLEILPILDREDLDLNPGFNIQI